ncbi:hypothetical protein DPMN_127521 [Dreissena polymorpha]|uniref:Uncharacterized protein n=1 Tax=Dreissena polymorpha TaxID=45954 RepID=A0A9D4GZ38_DREPO|nr:hypothetical protein DPMN_127521 [Dreissena polymorpha]
MSASVSAEQRGVVLEVAAGRGLPLLARNSAVLSSRSLLERLPLLARNSAVLSSRVAAGRRVSPVGAEQRGVKFEVVDGRGLPLLARNSAALSSRVAAGRGLY